MRLWLDDERTPPGGYTHTARTAAEAIALLKTGEVRTISLDHDLGEGNGSGYEVAAWIERAVLSGEIQMPYWEVHSMNPVGRARMVAALISAETKGASREA